MIFQDPMTSLNPTLKIGTQITETIRRHLDMSKAQARKRAVELLEEVQHPERAPSGSTTIRTATRAACASA